MRLSMTSFSYRAEADDDFFEVSKIERKALGGLQEYAEENVSKADAYSEARTLGGS